MRWRLIIEEYSPELIYIPGLKNIVADALSRLGIEGTENLSELDDKDKEMFLITHALVNSDTSSKTECFYSYDNENKNPNHHLDLDLYTGDESAEASHPLTFKKIHQAQQKDKSLMELLQKRQSYYIKKFRGGDKIYDIICNRDNIILPNQFRKRL